LVPAAAYLLAVWTSRQNGGRRSGGRERQRPLSVAFGAEHRRVSLVLKLEELSTMATKLYVGNLSPNTTEAQILDLFKQSGNVVSCVLIKDKVTGNSKGFAFVEMGSEAEAAKAMADRNGKELDGRALKVNEARPREERPMK
jgi:RNA recognition motif-containing protein